MSKFIPSWMKKEPVNLTDDEKDFKAKTEFAMIGPVSAGKSTIAAGIVHMCETLSILVPDFYARVFPRSTSILQDANNLKQGMFPEKTNPYMTRAQEAGIMICHRKWKNRKVRVPLYDLAGEITDHIVYKAIGNTPAQMIQNRMQNVNQDVVNTARDSDGFIAALPADEALMFQETPGPIGADVYIHTVLDAVMRYRLNNHKPDPYVIIVLTKWDTVIQRAKSLGMDAYDEEGGLERFLANGFPAMYMLLKPMRETGKVKYFRSYFMIKRRENGDPVCWPDTNKPIINILDKENEYIRYKPEMAEEDYKNLINYIGSFAK
jgi:hypothetical protein